MEKASLYICLSFAVLSFAKEDDISKLPLCPTSVDYFPQTLPMHCRMPRSADLSSSASEASPFYQNPPSEKQPAPIPIPLPPGGPVPYPFPGGPGAPFPMPMPMPVPMPGASHKLPVIVMPFYSPDPAFKKQPRQKQAHVHRRPQRPRRTRRPRPHHTDDTDSSTDTDTDTDSSDTDTDTDSSDTSSDSSNERGWWNGSRKRTSKRSGRRSGTKRHAHKSKRRQDKSRGELLTPVLQYVTKDGYVIFEKKISKGEAKDWLRMRSDDPDPNVENSVDELKGKELNHNEQAEEKKKDKNDDDNAEYEDKSDEKGKDEVTTVKSHSLKKHQKIKANSLLSSIAMKGKDNEKSIIDV